MATTQHHPLQQHLELVDASVTEFVDIHSEIAQLQARQAALLARVCDSATEVERSSTGMKSGVVHRSAQAELAAGVHLADRTIGAQMDHAYRLVNQYPQTFAQHSEGMLSAQHVRVILSAGLIIQEPSSRFEYERAVLAVASDETPGRLVKIAQALADKYATQTLEERHQIAARQRNVWVEDRDDGMADLFAHLPAVQAYAIKDRIDQIAYLKADEAAAKNKASSSSSSSSATSFSRNNAVPRATVGELRADTLTEMCLGTLAATHQHVAGRVQVTVPVFTLGTGDSRGTGAGKDIPGFYGTAWLQGYGPIDAQSAAKLAGDASGWDRVMTDAFTGQVVAVDRYQPTASVRRALVARDNRCRFPGCNIQTARCDIDHTIEWVRGGKTNLTNLAHLCRRHHMLKHHGNWRVKQHTGGVMEWLSPTGRTYVDRPVHHATIAAPTATTTRTPSKVRFSEFSEISENTENRDPVREHPPPF